jgi:DNA-binding transcriptional LysR family regulator
LRSDSPAANAASSCAPSPWYGVSARPAYTGTESVLPLAVHPEPSVTRSRIFEALKAAGRPYRIALVSSSVAVIQAAVTAGLGVSAFAGYVIPDGLVRLDQGLPPLGALDYVIDRRASVPAALALETVLHEAAREL